MKTIEDIKKMAAYAKEHGVNYLTRDFYAANKSKIQNISSINKIKKEFGSWSNAMEIAFPSKATVESKQPIVEEDFAVNFIETLKADKADHLFKVTSKTVPNGYKILILPDMHVPYHDETALEAALRCAEIYKPDEVIQIGDLLDFYGLSTYPRKTYTSSDLNEELNLATNILSEIKKRSGAKIATLIEGNHEARLRKFLLNKASQLKDLDVLKITNLLKLKEIGWDFISEFYFYKINNVYITHGEYATSNSVVKHMSEYNANIIHGHTHKISTQFKTGLDFQLQGAEIGCLSQFEVSSEYAKKPNWQHGFCTVEVAGNKTWINVHCIQSGEIFFQGNHIKVK